MMNIGYKTFALIGGDKRQLYCARSMADDGYEVILGGFDNVISMRGIKLASAAEAALNSEVIILPLPCLDKNGMIPSAFSQKPIALTQELQKAFQGKRILCGMADKLLEKAEFINKNLVSDYYNREDFVLSNAYVTAEGAIKIAMEKYEGTLNGAKILVCGYGRIGKALTRLLSGFCPDLTVSARKPEDLVSITLMGAKAVKTQSLYDSEGFDIIFSTVPSLIFGCELMAKIASDAVVIDLASGSGSVDYIAADRLNIDCIHALSLPGKSSPKTAGIIIRDTVYTMLEEENR